MTDVCSECASADPDCAKDVALVFDVTGNPTDWCWADLLAYATNVCYDELASNCMVSEAWLEMCIEDVCAASISGDPNPLAAAYSYCDNQMSVLESQANTSGGAANGTGSEAEPCSYIAHENYCIGPNGENLDKTYKSGGDHDLVVCKELCDADSACSAVEWYPTGNAGGRKCFNILDDIKAAGGLPSNKVRERQIVCYTKECGGRLACAQSPGVEATDSETRCMIPATPKQCEEFASGASVTMQNSSWSDFPKYCSHTVQGGQVSVRWNTNSGVISSVDNSTRQVCCGSNFLPVTTTTTTPAPEPLEPARNFTKPPLRPTVSAASIQRPADPVFGFCYAFGDPHVRPFDCPGGCAKIHMLDAYVSGNYWMVKSDAVWIQAHHAGRRLVSHTAGGKKFRNYAHITKLAVGGPFLQGSTLMVEGVKDGAQVWWNDNVTLTGAEPAGSKTDLEVMDGAVKIERENTKLSLQPSETALRFKIKIDFPEQVSVTITVYPRDEQTEASTFDVKMEMLQIDGMDGQCGNFNGNNDDDTPTKAGGIQDRFGGIANRIQGGDLLIPY